MIQNGKEISNVFGNYMGYMDFDGIRYFDYRMIDDIYHPYEDLPENKTLQSDSTKRLDLVLLKNN